MNSLRFWTSGLGNTVSSIIETVAQVATFWRDEDEFNLVETCEWVAIQVEMGACILPNINYINRQHYFPSNVQHYTQLK